MNGISRVAPKKGENYELRADLNSEYRDKRKDAIKRVIANMTVGKDVSGLFPDVLKNMQTEDLEQKKLVYLYLMNYAKTQPELVILAVNTFVKDSDDSNPLIRALSIRTMACLRAEKIIDYLSPPLQKALVDEHPYVRKTAAICVAKLYDLKPELAMENGFVESLKEMVGDANPMVVANAVTALMDIHIASQNLAESGAEGAEATKVEWHINTAILNKLLIALNECSEWGRVAILTQLARYTAVDERESEHICERVVPQLQHANGSVVLSAVKVIMIHMRNISAARADLEKQLIRKMAPPLVTLVSSAPEVQWVALRNINLLLQKRDDLLQNEMRVFFCKYNDPPYVKVEKLAIMVRLAGENNVDTLLSELREYASEVDVDFVRRSIKAIGQCAVKIESSAERCVGVLMDLINTRVSYVVQEAVVVVKDIFRKYPATYEGVIPTLCANLEELDEPEAKASLIWIIGEYAEKIDNAEELLGIFVDSFTEDPYPVQLQTLTAVVKLFLKRPDRSQPTLQKVLDLATKCDSPDVRDRAYIYWRLLSTDSGAARAVVMAHRPPISLPRTTVSPAVLEELIGEIGSLASVYHKPAETFVGKGRMGADSMRRNILDQDEVSAREAAIQKVAAGQAAENLLDFDDAPAGEGSAPTGIAAVVANTPEVSKVLTSSNPLDDLASIFGAAGIAGTGAGLNTNSGFGGLSAMTSPISTAPSQGLASLDMFASSSLTPAPAPASASQPAAQRTTTTSQQDDLLGLF
ncbi:beta-adaptin [Serendipita sp. 411]|nr:beta-adaptin [Serendipita sp. 401]KAG8855441.1 beta-adaptin [Serendipita sp. 411]KAG9056217.1 beta-adaptin [Serendipita sp. 407]